MRILVVDVPTDAPMLASLAANGELVFATSHDFGGEVARTRPDVIVTPIGSWQVSFGGALSPEARPALVLVGAAPPDAAGQAAIADADDWIAEGAGPFEI